MSANYLHSWKVGKRAMNKDSIKDSLKIAVTVPAMVASG